jgi:allophanate hydrolase
VGLKPTPGVLDMSGVLPACRTLDCVSIFAHTPDDAGIVYQVLSEDRQTAATRPIKFGFPRKPRVGIPDQPLFTDPLYEKGFGDAVEHMDAFATSISRFDMDTLNRVAKLLYDGPWVAERYAVIHDLITGGRPDLDSTVASVVGRGNQFTALDTFNAIYQLKDLSKTTQALWEQFDLIMVPTAPGIPSFKDVSEQPIEANSALGIYTNFVNLLGWSAIALPYCITSGGYPFGVTLIAPGGCDAALLSFAKTWLNDIGLPLGATQTYSANDAVNKINTSASTPPIWNDSILLAVVGAHLRGLPLHHELESVGAVLYSATTTSASYRLFALQGTTPAKPGLKRTESDGHSIEVEVYQIPAQNLADFISNIPSPLGIGSIELANSMWVKGFVCEPYGLENAIDVTHFGGWRAYQKSIGNG